MAKRFQKYILQPGTYYDGRGQEVIVTPDRLRHFNGQFNQMTANNYTVPIHWDHGQEEHDVIPLSVAELSERKKRSAKNTVGVMSDFQLIEDGNGGAQITLDVFDPKASEAAGANAIHVSPVILGSWQDGQKNQYSDVITHMDFVNLPSDNSQTPFEPVDGMIACSLRVADDEGRVAAQSGILMLSSADDDDDDDDDDLDLDIDDGSGGGDDLDGDEEDTGPADLGLDLDNPGTDDQALRDEISADLMAVGIVAPNADPVADPVDFIKQLCASLKQKSLDQSEGDEPDDDDDLDDDLDLDDDFDEEELDVQEPDFATMGLDPKVTEVLSGAWTAQQQEIAALKKRLDATEKSASAASSSASVVTERMIGMSRASNGERLTKLFESGRVTKEEYDARAEENEKITMSLDDHGNAQPTTLDVFIESREALKPNAAWPAIDVLTMATAHDPPTDTERMTPEKAKEINDELAKQIPGAMRRQKTA